MFSERKFFLPYQIAWIQDDSPLKIIEKSRQIGLTYADAYDSVLKATGKGPLNVYVSSRDDLTAREYLNVCKHWALALHIVVQDFGERIIDSEKDLKAHVLKFSSGKYIYSLSSNPNALVGKTGHIKLDEFAVHSNQRDLYRYAKPCTTWGGRISIISTHRGAGSVFNELIRSIKEQGNPMGFSHHHVDIHEAVRQGLVRKINQKSGQTQSDEEFIARVRSECIDQEQWLQEYCCQPADENSAFITWEMITAAETAHCLRPFSYLLGSTGDPPVPVGDSPTGFHSSNQPSIHPSGPNRAFYVGVDVARKQHLTVIDVGEKIGDVLWDRLRIELHDQPFSQIEHELWRILELSSVKRCCIDSTGLGMQLAERAHERFGWKVEPIHFTAPVKEQLAFELRNAFEDRRLRINPDPKLRADLRGIKKETTLAGNIRFVAESEDDGHCDRFWAMALRQHAANQKQTMGFAFLD